VRCVPGRPMGDVAPEGTPHAKRWDGPEIRGSPSRRVPAAPIEMGTQAGQLTGPAGRPPGSTRRLAVPIVDRKDATRNIYKRRGMEWQIEISLESGRDCTKNHGRRV